jgi:hypothetical protein
MKSDLKLVQHVASLFLQQLFKPHAVCRERDSSATSHTAVIGSRQEICFLYSL